RIRPAGLVEVGPFKRSHWGAGRIARRSLGEVAVRGRIRTGSTRSGRRRFAADGRGVPRLATGRAVAVRRCVRGSLCLQVAGAAREFREGPTDRARVAVRPRPRRRHRHLLARLAVVGNADAVRILRLADAGSDRGRGERGYAGRGIVAPPSGRSTGRGRTGRPFEIIGTPASIPLGFAVELAPVNRL